MKKILVSLLICLSLLWGCAVPSSDGDVVLDGPVLESMSRDGNLEFNGAVINSGTKPARSIYVVIIMKDENGKIVDAASSSVFGDSTDAALQPNRSVFFTVSTKVDPAKIASKEVEIYYENGSEQLPPSS